MGGLISLNWTIDQQTGRLTTSYGLDLGGNSIQNVSAILSASGKWRIGEDGKLVVQDLEVKGSAEFKGISKFKDLKIGTPENPQGITIYDKSGKPACIGVEDAESGAVKATSGECTD